MVDGTGTTEYTYYPIGPNPGFGANLMASIRTPFSTVACTYDATGRAVSRTVNGTAKTWTFDALNRVSAKPTSLGQFSFTYPGTSPLLAFLTFPNGQRTELAYQSMSNRQGSCWPHFAPTNPASVDG